jgi:hypothetical protein
VKLRFALLVPLLAGAALARADGLATSGILDPAQPFQIESARLRFTFFNQDGRGYQSLAGGPMFGPGSERLWVAEPQLEITARQGDRLTYRMWIPFDVVSAASPDAVDVVSTASRYQEAGAVDLAANYKATRVDEISTRVSVHLEENFRSWSMGLGWTRHFAEDNAVFQASLNQTIDWFDTYYLGGATSGRAGRSTTNLNIGFTQILSPTTVGNLNYGFTIQTGTLGNTWNTVPLVDGSHGSEILPSLRHRHAFVGRLVQALPWNGSLKIYYRFYVDNWGAFANTIEASLYQRINRYLYVRGSYRATFQKGVDFYTELAPLNSDADRTADSDLANFTAQTFGGKLALDVPLRKLKSFNADIAYERYIRSNNLQVDVYSCSVGLKY